MVEVRRKEDPAWPGGERESEAAKGPVGELRIEKDRGEADDARAQLAAASRQVLLERKPRVEGNPGPFGGRELADDKERKVGADRAHGVDEGGNPFGGTGGKDQPDFLR